MSTKGEILEMIKKLPEHSTVDDVMERLYIKTKIDAAIRELDEGKEVPHKEVKERFKEWTQ